MFIYSNVANVRNCPENSIHVQIMQARLTRRIGTYRGATEKLGELTIGKFTGSGFSGWNSSRGVWAGEFSRHLSKTITKNQKQLPGGVLWKRCSQKFCKIHRKTPVSYSKKRLRHRFFPVNFAKFLITPLYRTPPVAAFWH